MMERASGLLVVGFSIAVASRGDGAPMPEVDPRVMSFRSIPARLMKAYRYPSAMRSVFALVAFALQACAAGTALSSYPRRQIDRPYTLPAGVDALGSGIGGSVAHDNNGGPTVFLGLRPISWSVSLSDDWMLDFNPVPSAISYQFVRTDDQLLGATLSWGLGFGSEGVLITPALSVAHRMRLARSWAWSTVASGRLSRWTEQPRWGWSAAVVTGPLWQVTDTFSLQPAIAVSVARTNLLLSGLPMLQTARLTVPFGLAASLSLARQWDIDASVSYNGIGYPNGYGAYEGSLAFVHFW
jgi:hypothetical protein